MANGKQFQIQLQDTRTRYRYVSPNKQLEIYACKRFISPKRARPRHGLFPPATVAIFIDTIGKNVCQVAADRLQMCAKCANDACLCSISLSLYLSPSQLPHVFYIYEHMNLQLQLVVRSTRLSLKSRPSRWPNCKHSCILANRQPNTNVNTNPSSHSVPDSVRIHIHIRRKCVQLIN